MLLLEPGEIAEPLTALLGSEAIGVQCCALHDGPAGMRQRLRNLRLQQYVALAFGTIPYLLMTIVMIMAAGSTLDSTFASVAKSIGQEVPMLAGRKPGARAMVIGMWTMIVFALLGNIPMIAGTDILKATTISGTMVMGLAPVFLLAPLVKHSPWSFHLAFWPGVLLGILLAAGMIPSSWAIGDGKYALLLGVNFYGLGLCTVGFLLPIALQKLRGPQ